MNSSRAIAWCVHLYTAVGLLLAAAMAVLIVRGGADSFRWAFVLMLAATLIDATDGALARLARVKEVLPEFDGRRLDDIIDFLTYTCLPLLLLWRAQTLPVGWSWCLLVPLVASAYGFCQVEAKTSDGYFLGFPSYWNLVAFYLYVLDPPPRVSVTLLLVLALLTFVPTRYLYPSQRGRFSVVTNVLAVAWIGLPVWVLYRLPSGATSVGPMLDDQTRGVALVSLFFPVYYMLASWAVTLKLWLGSGRENSAVGEDPLR